jgi:hypothetical protein
MAVQKLSQIALSPSNPVAADQFVGIHGGNTDYQFSLTQLIAGIGAGGGSSITINTTPILGGTDKQFVFDNAGTFGETVGITYMNTNPPTLGYGMAIAGGTVTDPDARCLLMTQTLNNGAAQFDGPFLFQLTNTASAASSLAFGIQSPPGSLSFGIGYATASSTGRTSIWINSGSPNAGNFWAQVDVFSSTFWYNAANNFAGAPKSHTFIIGNSNNGMFAVGINMANCAAVTVLGWAANDGQVLGNTSAIDTGVSRTGAAALAFGNGTASDTSATLLAKAYVATGDPGSGVASTNTLSNANSTTISTGVGSVRMSSANAATNTGWLKCYIGTQVAWIPAWTTNSP